MPAGVPVATVGIGNSKNAGILAARIISSGADEIAKSVQEKLAAYQSSLTELAIQKGDALTQRIKNLISPNS
jgi:5-(carboxyamino)imidazole ribonucleotide mutase